MLWISRQRRAGEGFLQTGAADSVLVNIITYTNYCLSCSLLSGRGDKQLGVNTLHDSAQGEKF